MEYTNAEKEIGIDVEYNFVDWVQGFPNDKTDTGYHGHFKIALLSRDTRKEFDYYGSSHDAGNSKDTLSDDDLKGALRCIVDDALFGRMDFEEFCSELRYDDDSRKAERIHKACIKTFEELSELGLIEDDFYTIINDLQEF